MLKPISKLLVLALVAMVGFSACSEDETNTIADVLEDDARFSTLKALLDQTGLTATLEGAGTFTLFAPTNTALSGVDPADFTNEELREVLLYHVLGSTVRAAGIPAGKTYLGTAAPSAYDDNPLSVLINNDSGVRLNNAANVTETDINADNGVIHVIDAILMPLDIVGHASANDEFSSLVATLAGTDSDGDGSDGELVGILQGAGPFTVFAPINQAFTDITDTVDGLTDTQVGTVLTYHVVQDANVLSTTLTNGQVVSTVANQDFTIGIDNGTVTITDASGGVSTITGTDVQGTNGVIHVLDRVLIPSL